MHYRPLGRTGVLVSELCLGTMTFGGAGTPPWDAIGGLDVQAADRLVGRALEAGVNFVDTADRYGGGETEEILGQVLGGGRRDEVVLATKVYNRVGPGANDVGLSRRHVMRALEGSLRRMRTDHVDLYQVHSFDPLTPLEETLRTLDDAVRQGKVRSLGCSNYAAWQIAKALGVSALHDLERFASVQAYYSLAGRDVEHELVPFALDADLSLLVWSPLAGGLLSGKFTRATAQDAGARRAQADFPPVDRALAYDVVDVAAPIAAGHGVSVAQVALAWLLARPAVTSVTIGAKRLDQLDDNLAAVDLVLADDELAALEAAGRPAQQYPAWVQAFGAPERLPR